VHAPGLRERRKEQTRLALTDAALELFLAKGYEGTTVDEIVAAVNVSQRTFFRYFASKEEVVTSFGEDFDRRLIEEMAARPDCEAPRVALVTATRVVMDEYASGEEVDMERFRRLRKVTETTPALLAAQLARRTVTERLLVAEVARRQGTDPSTDLRPQLLVAFYMAAVRVGFKDCADKDVFDPPLVIRRVAEAAIQGMDALRPDWDLPA
jgi:AcrR family transcriptional regulator